MTTRLRVRVKNRMYDVRERYGYHIPEFNEYEGEIVPNPTWVDDNHFCLTMNEGGAPFRVISKDLIECGWLMPSNNVSRATTKVVDGNNGKKYVITRRGNGWSCNCTGFSYRKTCSHIKQAEKSDV